MAKIVVAGRSDCPYFAKVELLGDRLAKNLKKFKLHKIMIQPDQWDKWLRDTCAEKGWSFSKSPMVWRELIDRGGKGVLIGGANDFQEYVKAYYDLESEMNSYDMRTIAAENKITKDELDAEEAEFKALSNPVHVCITDAGNPTCYHLLNTISSGKVLGPKYELTIRLLVSSPDDIDAVTGMAWEAEDLAHGLLKGVKVFTSAEEAFENCSFVIMLDNLLKTEDESKREWLLRNEAHFGNYAEIINDKALADCKVLVCGDGPTNFNALQIIQKAPRISRKNVVAVASVVEIHAKSVIGETLHVNPAGVVSLLIWGNINGKRYFDVSKSRVHSYDGAVWGPYWHSVSTQEMVHDNKWIREELPTLVAERQHKVSDAMSRPISLSTANAIATTLQYWCRGSPETQTFSLGVYSEGWYGVPEGLVFSLPVRMDPKGYWHVVEDIGMTFESKEGIAAAVQDLKAELKLAKASVDGRELELEGESGEVAGTDEEKQKEEEGTEEVKEEGAENKETENNVDESAEAKATEGESNEVKGEQEASAESKEADGETNAEAKEPEGETEAAEEKEAQGEETTEVAAEAEKSTEDGVEGN